METKVLNGEMKIVEKKLTIKEFVEGYVLQPLEIHTLCLKYSFYLQKKVIHTFGCITILYYICK